MFVLGNSYSDNYTYFEITFSRCFDRVDCKEYDDVTAALSSTYVHVAVVNTFFDFDDYVAPIHTYLDDRFYFDLVPGFEKEQILYTVKPFVQSPPLSSPPFVQSPLCLVPHMKLEKSRSTTKFDVNLNKFFIWIITKI